MTALIAAAYRSLTWGILIRALRDVAKVSTMIFFVIAASSAFANMLAFSGGTDGALKAMAAWQLTPLTAVLLMICVLLFLGCFLDQVSMMLLTLPFFMPLAAGLKIDIIWLGVIFLISMQIGLLTPPFGLLLFVMKGVAPPQITMRQVYAAATPFTIMTIAVLFLVVAVPWLATALPRLIN